MYTLACIFFPCARLRWNEFQIMAHLELIFNGFIAINSSACARHNILLLFFIAKVLINLNCSWCIRQGICTFAQLKKKNKLSIIFCETKRTNTAQLLYRVLLIKYCTWFNLYSIIGQINFAKKNSHQNPSDYLFFRSFFFRSLDGQNAPNKIKSCAIFQFWVKNHRRRRSTRWHKKILPGLRAK